MIQSLRELAKELYGESDDSQPDVIRMFQQGFSTPTVSRIKDISTTRVQELVTNEYVRQGIVLYYPASNWLHIVSRIQ